MSRARTTQVLTLTVLLAAFAIAVGRKHLSRPEPAQVPTTAQDAIYAMVAAARAGDVSAYLANYSGAMLSSLEQSVRETGNESFSKYLKESNAAIKGIALSEPQQVNDREMKVRVEYVYQDRNEAQTIYLELLSGKWRIARVDGSERVKTLIPYGTPVQ